MSFGKALSIILLISVTIVHAFHFRGGSITWRPMNNTPSGSTVQIQIRQRYAWRHNGTNPQCSNAFILAQGLIGDNSSVSCYSGMCTGWSLLNTMTMCTDFSTNFDVSSGEITDLRIVNLNASFSIGFISAVSSINLVVGSNGNWNLMTRINTFRRPDGLINSSPIAATLPIIYKVIGVTHVYVLRLSDFDGTDILRCRWSTSMTTNFNNFNECGHICNGVPGAILFNNCTLRFTLTMANWYAPVVLQVEDYYDSSATVPMSSVGFEFLFYGYSNASLACRTQPVIVGDRANRDCIEVDVGQNITENVIAQVGCPGKTIIDFVTNSPLGMTKSVIQNSSTGDFQIVLNWIPTSAQRGSHSLCVGAVDNTKVQSDPWCITFLVGAQSVNVIRPTLLRGSASPSGTILHNRTVFSIQTSIQTVRPNRNGTYIHFRNAATNAIVQSYDWGSASEITYSATTITIRFPVAPWVPGNSYYVTFDSGIVSPIEICGPKSAAITDPLFWSFNISNSGLSSTSTNPTTASTTGFVTTTTPSTTVTSATVTVTTAAPSTTTTSIQTTTTGITITTSTTTNAVTTSASASTTTVRATCAASSATALAFSLLMTMIALIFTFYI